MSNVIDLIERMGQDARLRHASAGDVELALAQAQVDPEIKAAILARDQRRLEILLEGHNVCLALCPAEEEEDGGAEETPSRDDEEIPSESAARRMASAD